MNPSLPDPDPVTTVELLPLLHPLFSTVLYPPKRIWIEGKASAHALIQRLPDHGFAVVGTRAPDKRAIFLTQETIRRLRGTEIIIISGLARGIDSVAHEAALSAGLPTVVVLGCGIQRTYPMENHRLRKRIIEAGGLVLSEFAPESVALPSFFIQRNRLIAGFSKATWIVQSGFRSGALNTAHSAMKQQRHLYVTPCFPGDPSFLGNEALLMGQPEARALWSAENLSSTWLSLFSSIEKNRRDTANVNPLDLILEIENGLREGASLLSILEARSLRTGEPMHRLIQKVEQGHGA